MGLSDIDEDEPVTHSPGRPIVLAPPPTSAWAPPVVIPDSTPLSASPHVKQNRYVATTNSASASGASVLDDLFGDVDISVSPAPSSRGNASPVSASSPVAGRPMPATKAAAPSVLDDLFAAPTPPPTKAAGGGANSSAVGGGTESHAMLYVDGSSGPGAEDDGNNLFDLSKPVKKDKYNNAESFLDAFERQGKKSGGRADQSETLASLTRNKDDNKVRARLLALMNYYDVLGVSQTASEDEIKRSYKKKALELHPDRVGRSQTQEEAELFKTITKAHEVLTDPEQRRKYDASLTGGQPSVPSVNDWWSHVNM